MSLQTMPIDTGQLTFRYHGASEYKAYNSDTDEREKDQARDEDTGFPVYTVRCQVLFPELRESGEISVRVPLAEPPGDVEFEAPVTFSGVTAKQWRMNGRDGQTWTAQAMTLGAARRPSTSPPPGAAAKDDKADAKAA